VQGNKSNNLRNGREPSVVLVGLRACAETETESNGCAVGGTGREPMATGSPLIQVVPLLNRHPICSSAPQATRFATISRAQEGSGFLTGRAPCVRQVKRQRFCLEGCVHDATIWHWARFGQASARVGTVMACVVQANRKRLMATDVRGSPR
jgi:hypothetical protein